MEGNVEGEGSYHSREPVPQGVKQLTERHCTTDASKQRKSCTLKSKNVLVRRRGEKYCDSMCVCAVRGQDINVTPP